MKGLKNCKSILLKLNVPAHAIIYVYNVYNFYVVCQLANYYCTFYKLIEKIQSIYIWFYK